MQKHQSSGTGSSVLSPSIPVDIGESSQRQRIIDAMVASCAEKTYAATTITDIVSRARISRTTFYKRFADKRDCFDASVEFCLGELRDAARSARSPGDPPANAIRRAAAATLRAMATRPALAQLLTGDAVAVDPSVGLRFRSLVIPSLEEMWARAGGAVSRHLDPDLAFGRAQLLVFNQVASGRSAELTALLPDIVYLAVAPFVGHDLALEQAQLARGEIPNPPPER